MTRSLVLAAAVSAGFAAAQNISIGIKGGYTTGSLKTWAPSNIESKPYSIGPSVEFKLPFNLFAETSVLYSRLGQSVAYTYPLNGTGLSTSRYRLRANSWEFPVIIRKYLDNRWGGRPFIGGGYALRAVQVTDYSFMYVPAEGPPLSGHSHPWFESPTHGYVATAGFERAVRGSRFVFAPELRYTRWLTTPQAVGGPWKQDRLQVMLGLKFR